MLKLNVPALERDIPKYQQNMLAEAYRTWIQWLETVKCASNPEEYTWAIATLKLAAKTVCFKSVLITVVIYRNSDAVMDIDS